MRRENSSDENQIIKRVLIGMQLKVIDAKNKDYIGIEGKVIRETKNAIVVDQDGREKTVLKQGAVFEVENKGKKIRIEGKTITKRVEDKPKLRI